MPQFQGSCFECGPENENCAKMGYPSIGYKSIIEKYYKRQNVQFFLNTGSSSPFCRKLQMIPLT